MLCQGEPWFFLIAVWNPVSPVDQGCLPFWAGLHLKPHKEGPAAGNVTNVIVLCNLWTWLGNTQWYAYLRIHLNTLMNVIIVFKQKYAHTCVGPLNFTLVNHLDPHYTCRETIRRANKSLWSEYQTSSLIRFPLNTRKLNLYLSRNDQG